MTKTSGALVAKKMANALIPEAEAIDVLKITFAGLGLVGKALGHGGGDPIETIRKAYGGLWVGGEALLYEKALEFKPNAMNRAVHKGDMSFRIALRDIDAVTDRFGLVSGIIDLECGGAIVSIRTFGAKQFADEIRRRSPNAAQR